MASTLWRGASSSIVSGSAASPLLRRRLPLVGAFCVLSLGLANFAPTLSSSFKTGCAQSLPFVPPLRSSFSSQSSARALHSTGMEGSSSTVPSIVVYVTVPNKEAGKKLGESLVKEKLAACVNIVPGIQSIYQWQGEILIDRGTSYKLYRDLESILEAQTDIQTDSEELLIIKTRESLLESLTEHVKANHDYDVPEVIALPIKGGSLQYLEWLKNSTRE